MSRKIVLSMLIVLIAPIFSVLSAEVPQPVRMDKKGILIVKQPAINMIEWLIVNEESVWTEAEIEWLAGIMQNTLGALEKAGLNGVECLDGYRFRHWAGEFAKDKDGKIAVVNHSDREIVLSDTILIPGWENEFFIYHELGHIVNRCTGGALSGIFHDLITRIDGVVSLHDWTTAGGFWMRGQAHINRNEATADAFALWVWMDYAGLGAPTFHDTPASAQPDAIRSVFQEALASIGDW